MKQKNVYALTSLYAVTMLLILLCSVLYLLHVLKKITTSSSPSTPEYIYVDQTPSPPPSDELPSEDDEKIGWIIKEYEGKIGIFQKDGTLFQVIDTYVKTLPKADQRLLGEGFEIQTQSELNSIIEDYSD